jgi:excisionase family DNA binding protein
MDTRGSSGDRFFFGQPPGFEGKSTPRLAYSIEEFAEATGLSRSLLYETIRIGELSTVKIRSRRLILLEDGTAWLRSHREATS